MLASMYSGVSGLGAHQQRMNVIANDIANVNTVGYKQSNVTFREALVDTLISPAVGTPGRQLGLGVQMGTTTRDFGRGALTETGITSNMAVQGEGFFAVQAIDPATATAVGDTYYTRAGDYVMDVKNDTTIHLILPDGKALLGVDGEPINLKTGMPAASELVSFAIAYDGSIVTTDADGNNYEPGKVAVVGFQNNNGLKALGSNLYEWTEAANPIEPALDGRDNAVGVNVLQGYLESSNVDLATEFTDMIVAQRGFQANSKSITTSDEMLQELLRLKR